jgi:cytochrome P450
MLFWHLTGFDNIVLSEGQIWKSQSDLLRNAIRQAHLLSIFSVLSQKLIERIGKGGTVVWNEYTRRFTLDAVGLTIFGHDFQSLDLVVRGEKGGAGTAEKSKSGQTDVSVQYSNMMNGIANPVYLALPILEKLWPRRQLVGEIEAFRETVMNIVKEKRKVPGDDVVSRLLEVPSLSNEMVLNTSISILMAGHVRSPPLSFSSPMS